MTKPPFLILAGLTLVGLAILEFSRAMKTGRIKLRGGARITRSRSPRIFWFNVGFQVVVACDGTALVLWGLFQDRSL